MHCLAGRAVRRRARCAEVLAWRRATIWAHFSGQESSHFSAQGLELCFGLESGAGICFGPRVGPIFRATSQDHFFIECYAIGSHDFAVAMRAGLGQVMFL